MSAFCRPPNKIKKTGGVRMNDAQEEYLTVAELSEKIKFSRQTIYNLISKKVFEINKHFIKPRPKKILFKWTQVRAWMENPLEDSAEASGATCPEGAQLEPIKNTRGRTKSAIRI
jgi:predicted DNA-binding transcriptional regulator AlpA